MDCGPRRVTGRPARRPRPAEPREVHVVAVRLDVVPRSDLRTQPRLRGVVARVERHRRVHRDAREDRGGQARHHERPGKPTGPPSARKAAGSDRVEREPGVEAPYGHLGELEARLRPARRHVEGDREGHREPERREPRGALLRGGSARRQPKPQHRPRRERPRVEAGNASSVSRRAATRPAVDFA